MFTKKIIIKKESFLFGFLMIGLVVIGLAGVDFAFSQNCPSNTQSGETTATLVGEITDNGGDSNLEAWFQWGKTDSYGSETSHQFTSNTGSFCSTITNLQPGTTYNFRAVAKNNAGTSYGENKSFITLNNSPTADIKVNNSNGPITLKYQDSATFSWTSNNADSCTASGDWSGSKSTSGSQSIQLTTVKTYTFTLTCARSLTGQTFSDSVQVIVNAIPPKVITKPVVVTY